MAKQKESKIDNQEKETNEVAEKPEHHSSKKDARDRQALILLGGFALIIIIFVAVFAFIRMSNNFTYEGIKFSKITEGKLTYYNAAVPALDQNGRVTSYVAFQFRNDPRKLRDIPVATNGINFAKDKTLFISYDNLKICEDNMLAAVNFDIVLSNFGLTNKRSGLANESYARETNLTYVNCETNPLNTVILVKNGNETKIEQTSKNCYEIVSYDCDILKAMEKFQLELIKEYVAKLQ
jgi:hypothetical protein